jgi:hypothetical protein
MEQCLLGFLGLLCCPFISFYKKNDNDKDRVEGRHVFTDDKTTNIVKVGTEALQT